MEGTRTPGLLIRSASQG